MKLSVIIITQNEEKNIGRCIDSVKSIADEIVIVDSGSTDRTEEIALSLNAHFHKTKWKSYGTSRNIAADKAVNDWLLALDADEALSEQLKESIRHLISTDNKSADAFSFNRLTNYCGKWIRHSGWYPDRKIRIYNKKQTQWNDEIVHEALTDANKLKVQHLKGDLLHYSYYSQEEHKERADKYSRLTALKMHNAKKPASVLKPFISMIARFISMYILKLGFLDGRAGFDIARISAVSNRLKYRELRRLNKAARV